MPNIGELLKATARGIGKLPRLIGDQFAVDPEAMPMPSGYPGGFTPPFNPNAGTGIPTLDDMTQMGVEGEFVQNPRAVRQVDGMMMPRRKRRGLRLIGDLVGGAMDGLATPNVAMGGPVDMARAFQSGRDGARGRAMQDFNMAIAQDRALRERQMIPLRELQIQEEIEAAKARKAASEATAERQRRLGSQPDYVAPIAVGGGRLYNPATGEWITPPEQQEPMETVTADFAKAIGFAVADDAKEVKIPRSILERAVAPYVSATKTPAAVQTREADVEAYASGLIAQNPNISEEEAMRIARIWQQQKLQVPVSVGQARIGALGATTGNTNARTENTRVDTEKDRQTLRVRNLADRVIADAPGQDMAVAETNVLNPSYYANLTEQERVSVAAEVRRRKQQAEGKAREGLGAILGGARPGGIVTPPKPRGAGGQDTPPPPPPPAPTRKKVRLMHPQTGQIRDFELTDEELKDAKRQQFVEVR